MQAFISCSGEPSLVISPLYSFTATGTDESALRCHCAREITPEAPSPKRCCRRSVDQSISGVASSAAASASVSSGLPAYASQVRLGRVSSHCGSSRNWLAAMRISSRRWHWLIDVGSACRRLPASSNFCRYGRSPSSLGRVSMQLSVRINQRSSGGNAAPDTWRMRLALKPIIVSAAHWPTHSGTSVKWLSEQNRMRMRVSRCRSSGRLLKALPLRLSTSSVSASSKISRGNSVRPQDRSSRVMPDNSPARN